MSLHIDRRVLAANDVTERDAVRRQILQLHKQGAQPHDLAIRFGMTDAEVRALIFNDDNIFTIEET